MKTSASKTPSATPSRGYSVFLTRLIHPTTFVMLVVLGLAIGFRFAESPSSSEIRSAVPASLVSKKAAPRPSLSPSHSLAAPYIWVPGASVSWAFQTSLKIEFAKSSDEPGIGQVPMLDLKMVGTYHLRVLTVGVDEVRALAQFEPSSIINGEEPLPEVTSLFRQTPCVLVMGKDGSLRDLLFPPHTSAENVMVLRAAFAWQYAIQAGSTAWARQEQEDTSIVIAEYRIGSNPQSSTKQRLTPASTGSGPGTRMAHSHFEAVVGDCWLASLEGSESKSVLNEGIEFATTASSVSFQRIACEVSDAFATLVPQSYQPIRGVGADEASRLRDIPLEAILAPLQQASAQGRSLGSYSQEGQAFLRWLEASPGQAPRVLQALREPLPDGQAAYMTRGLADTAPTKAALLLSSAAEFPTDTVFQQIGSITTARSIASMPSTVGSALAQVFNNESTQPRERDAALLALGKFAGSHSEWAQPLWDSMDHSMTPEAEVGVLSTGFNSLANSRTLIPAAFDRATSVGLSHADTEVRLSAVSYLASLPDSPQAAAHLQRVANQDPDSNIRSAAQAALQEFGQTSKTPPAQGPEGESIVNGSTR